MSGLFARIFKQWAEEAVVNKLASSKSFQSAATNVVKLSEEAQNVVADGIKDPKKVSHIASSFLNSLQNEIKKDLNKYSNGFKDKK